jgi:hypothetical protein
VEAVLEAKGEFVYLGWSGVSNEDEEKNISAIILHTTSPQSMACGSWNKETSWILLGLNPHFTKMDQNKARSSLKGQISVI